MRLLQTACSVGSEVSQEDQQKIDMFMQNQQQRGRRRMPLSALRQSAPVRPGARPMFPGRFRLPGMQHRPLFFPRIGSRVPFGRSIAGINSSAIPPTGRMMPRQKILVNPHFRGSPGMTMVQTPSTQPASTYPNLLNMEIGRPAQQHPQFTVKLTNFTLILV